VAVRRKLWQAITAAEDILLDEETSNDVILRSVHAIGQAVASYVKLLDSTELESRLSELEEKLKEKEEKIEIQSHRIEQLRTYSPNAVN